jgi:hypothetical protein
LENSNNKEKRKSVFRQYDEAEIIYNELEAKLASKQIYRDLINKAVLMSLKGEV